MPQQSNENTNPEEQLHAEEEASIRLSKPVHHQFSPGEALNMMPLDISEIRFKDAEATIHGSGVMMDSVLFDL